MSIAVTVLLVELVLLVLLVKLVVLAGNGTGYLPGHAQSASLQGRSVCGFTGQHVNDK
jgi:hypothetical protein